MTESVSDWKIQFPVVDVRTIVAFQETPVSCLACVTSIPSEDFFEQKGVAIAYNPVPAQAVYAVGVHWEKEFAYDTGAALSTKPKKHFVFALSNPFGKNWQGTPCRPNGHGALMEQVMKNIPDAITLGRTDGLVEMILLPPLQHPFGQAHTTIYPICPTPTSTYGEGFPLIGRTASVMLPTLNEDPRYTQIFTPDMLGHTSAKAEGATKAMKSVCDYLCVLYGPNVGPKRTNSNLLTNGL